MINKLDYNSEEVMKILSNESYTDEQKKNFFEKYKSDLKSKRKKQIIEEVNELAKKIPIITEEIYIDFLKKYEDDNLSKPFSIIEKEIKEFEVEMTEKYNNYLEEKKKEEQEKEPIVEEPTPDPVILAEQEEKEEPKELESFENDDLGNSVLNEEPETLAKPLVDDFGTAKDVMPDTTDSLGERGNASAIIISIIAIIIGVVVMYSIIKIN